MANFTAAEASSLIIAGEAPVDMQVSGDLDLNYRTITTLPAGLSVDGDLSLSDTSMTKLPRGLRVSGDLDLRWTKVTALPADMIVGGSICLADSAIQTLPDGIAVAGDLDLARSAITTLPEGLNVGGTLDLTATAVTSLPEGITIGGYLDLGRSAITALPDYLTVGGSLYMDDTRIATLPPGLTVGGHLGLRGSAIAALPADLNVGGTIYRDGAALAAEAAAVEANAGATRELHAGAEATTGAVKFPKELASPACALTIRQISELVQQEKLGEFDGKSLIEIARTVTAARAEADRAGEQAAPDLMTARKAIWEERAIRAEQARLMEGWTDEPGRESKERAMRGVAERIVRLSRMANAIDEDDGLGFADRASSTRASRRAGREEFDLLAGADGMAAPARLYVIMRQAQRKGDDNTVHIAAAYCEYADRGVVSHDEAVTALTSLGAGLTKRMRETVQKSGHEASPAVAADTRGRAAAHILASHDLSRRLQAMMRQGV